MSDLLITRTGTGVAVARSTDPFSTFQVHRIDRERWRATPETSGIYVLYGLLKGEPTAYVGMSTTNMRSRISSHHLSEKKAWFGVLFAIPLPTDLCQSAEAELISRASSAEVVTLANAKTESHWLQAENVHLAPALESVVGALELLLGNDIFTARDEPADDAGNLAASGKGRGEWTADEWMEAARVRTGTEYADGVREIATAWESFGDGARIGFGGGKVNAALFPTLDAGSASYWALAIYPTWIEVPFQWLAYRPATESEEFRRDLLNRLNAIEGIDLDETKLNGRPPFQPAVIADPETRRQVLDVLRWFAGEVTRRSIVASPE